MEKVKKTIPPRKRKALLVLPLIVLPFVTMAFWALGGGKGADHAKDAEKEGLNLQLPDARLKDDKDQNKLSFYEAAERDSSKWRAGLQNDPFYQLPKADTIPTSYSYDPSPSGLVGYQDPNEQKVYQKLAALNRQLSEPATIKKEKEIRKGSYSLPTDDVNRLDHLMQQMASGTTEDPELKQLNGMMDKILDIQHPERVKDRVKELSVKDKEKVFAVTRLHNTASFSLLDTAPQKETAGGFYGLEAQDPDQDRNAIAALVHGSQVLVDGSIIKLRLTDPVWVAGQRVPEGSFVFGKTSLQGERLQVSVSSIRVGGSLHPVQLEVYDLDGLPGIHIPGAITREVAKQSADNSLQMLELGTLDPSLKAQATAAGISAAKSLLSKKAKLVKVTVKAGYQVLLRNKG